MFPGIFKTINVPTCRERPQDKQQELCNLYLNGMIPHLSGDYWPQFTTLFHMYMRMHAKSNEFGKYDEEGTITPFVESLLPKAAPPKAIQKQPPQEKKPRKYIINGVLYYEK
jgi:hypothetical protein